MAVSRLESGVVSDIAPVVDDRFTTAISFCGHIGEIAGRLEDPGQGLLA